MGRLRLRSRVVAPLRERERDGLDPHPREAAPGRAGQAGQRKAALREGVRVLSRRGPAGSAAGVPLAARDRGALFARRDHDPPRPGLGTHAVVQAARAARPTGAIVDFITRGLDTTVAATGPSPMDMAYLSDGYKKFLDPDGYPAIRPPWGTLNAIDINTGEYAWRIPLGEYPELAAKGMTRTGSENYGGPLVTAGGLVFIAATSYDKKLRAFDKRDGTLLWEATLPAAGNATPATYEVEGTAVRGHRGRRRQVQGSAGRHLRRVRPSSGGGRDEQEAPASPPWPTSGRRASAPRIGVGMLGYAFMGKAHSNAYKTLPYMMYPPVAIPELVAICGRDQKAGGRRRRSATGTRSTTPTGGRCWTTRRSSSSTTAGPTTPTPSPRSPPPGPANTSSARSPSPAPRRRRRRCWTR